MVYYEAIISVKRAGVAQLVELQPSKLDVASSNLVSRSRPQFGSRNTDKLSCGPVENKQGLIKTAHVAQSVERFLGKEEVHRFNPGRGLHYFFKMVKVARKILFTNASKLIRKR